MSYDHFLETWRNLSFIGYEGYDVSDRGRVRNTVTGQIIRPHPNGNRVEHVGLYLGGIRSNKAVGLLVAKAFLESPPNDNYNTVTHRDGNPKNNSYENLEWRPKWFTVKYHKEIHNNALLYPKTPVIEETTGKRFLTGKDASMYFCLLESQIHRSCEDGSSPMLSDGKVFSYIGEDDI